MALNKNNVVAANDKEAIIELSLAELKDLYSELSDKEFYKTFKAMLRGKELKRINKGKYLFKLVLPTEPETVTHEETDAAA